jgi:DNA polymerase III delta prime subunit
MQDQNIGDSEINDSDVRLVQAGRDAIQGDRNQITNIYVDLVGRKQKQWNSRQASILQQMQADVQQRLMDVLNDEKLIPLRMRETLESVNRSPLKSPRTLTTPAQGTIGLDPEVSIFQVFCRKDIAGKLLILGEPGAGKTTTLLTLADSLIAESLTTPGTTIPIIFELSAWKDDRQSIQDWLVEQLKQLYNLSPQESQKWLDDRLLLPLLDGLDELGMERQQRCIAKINQFARHYPQVVVCCRAEEYRLAGATLGDLRGAVCLEPLTDEQIAGYLQSLHLEALWTAVQSSPQMRQMLEPDAEGKPGILRVPLLLSIAAVAYEGKPFDSRGALYEAYIDKRLALATRRAERDQVGKQGRGLWQYADPNQEPDWRQTQRTLRWLARQLQQNNTVELLIERIQPSWLETKQVQRRYWLIGWLSGWLISGLIFGLSVGLIFGLSGWLSGWLIFGLIGGLSIGLIFRLIFRLDSIEPVEAFKISMSPEVRRKILNSLKGWLIFGLSVGLSGWLIFGLSIGLSVGLSIGLSIGLIGGLSVGLSIGLSGWLIFGLIGGLKQDLQLRSHPNQGIWNSLQSLLWTTVLSYPLGIIFTFGITVLPSTVAEGMSQGEDWLMILSSIGTALPQFLIPGVFGALLFGFAGGGGLPCVQHVCLRFVLWQSGVAPWNLARFLNYCVERRLLQRVGGRYRFLHRELLDYFAGLQ